MQSGRAGGHSAVFRGQLVKPIESMLVEKQTTAELVDIHPRSINKNYNLIVTLLILKRDLLGPPSVMVNTLFFM